MKMQRKTNPFWVFEKNERFFHHDFMWVDDIQKRFSRGSFPLMKRVRFTLYFHERFIRLLNYSFFLQCVQVLSGYAGEDLLQTRSMLHHRHNLLRE
jgi:hypothetical protein